jgi:hypothetical protein
MKKQFTIGVFLVVLFIHSQLSAQNTGIGEPNPASKLSVKGNMSIGNTYSGVAAPTGSLIIEGTLGLGTSSPNASAILEISSTAKGVLMPRLTRIQRLAISNPAKGLLVFDIDSNTLYFHDGNNWLNFPAINQLQNTVSGMPSGSLGGTGATGPIGPTGFAGVNGTNGTTGPTGANGATGPAGANGMNGVTGATGPAGVNGATGFAGATGATGATGLGYNGVTSSSSLIIGTGSKTITVNVSGAVGVGSRIRVASTNTPANYAEGVVTSLSGTTIIFNSDNTGGSGTYSTWNISLAGDKGAAGTLSGVSPGQAVFGSANGGVGQSNSFFWDNSNSRLGVGTSSPQNTFSVGLSSQFQVDNSGNVSITSSGSVTVASLATGQLLFPSSTGRVSQSNSLFWDNTNSRLGIGTSTPANTFSVGSSSQFQINSSGDIVKIKNVAYSFPSNQASANQVLTNDGAGNLSWATASGANGWSLSGNSGTTAGTNFIGTNDNRDLVFKTNGTEKMRIQSNGLIGIGCTTVPTNKWIVASSLAAPTFTSGANGFGACFPGGAGFYVKNSTDGVEGKYESYNGKVHIGVASNTFAPLVFYTEGSTEAARLDITGYFGIGTSTPSQKMEVSNGSVFVSNTNNSAGQIILQEPSNAGTHYTAFKAQAQAANITYTLPATEGTSGQVLSTTGAGNLSWTSLPEVNCINNATSIQTSANFNIDGSGTLGGTLSVTGTTTVNAMDVNGFFAAPITTTTSNITLGSSHYTVILTGGTPTVTLPSVSASVDRIYVIVNQTSSARTISSYKNLSGANATTVAATSSLFLQSNGTNWYQIR